MQNEQNVVEIGKTRSSGEKPFFNIMLDVDETLAYVLSTKDDEDLFLKVGLIARGERIQLPSGDIYYLFPGVRAFLQKLLSMEDVQVWIFSAGSPERNEELMKTILMPEEFKKIKILSKGVGEATKSQQPGQVREWGALYSVMEEKEEVQGGVKIKEEVWKKDFLSKIENPAHRKYTILVDDNKERIIESQKTNALIVTGLKKHHTDALLLYYSNLITEIQVQEYTDATSTFLFIAINQVFYAAGLLLSAMDAARKDFEVNEGKSDQESQKSMDSFLSSYVNSLPESASFNPFKPDDFGKMKGFYEKGLGFLKEVDEKLEFYQLLSRDQVEKIRVIDDGFGKFRMHTDEVQETPFGGDFTGFYAIDSGEAWPKGQGRGTLNFSQERTECNTEEPRKWLVARRRHKIPVINDDTPTKNKNFRSKHNQ